MTKLQEIQESVEALSDKEVRELFAWLEELQAERWDQQFETDVKAGKFDKLADQALEHLDAGRTRPL